MGAAPILATMPTTRSSFAPRSIASTKSRSVNFSVSMSFAVGVSGAFSRNGCSRFASRMVFAGTFPLEPMMATIMMANPISQRAPRIARKRTIALDMVAPYSWKEESNQVWA